MGETATATPTTYRIQDIDVAATLLACDMGGRPLYQARVDMPGDLGQAVGAGKRVRG